MLKSIKYFYYYLIPLFIVSLVISAHSQNTPEIRGLWVVRHSITTSEQIDSLLNLSHRYHFTDLFVQVRGRGDAFYNSRFELKAEEIKDPDFDPLRYIFQHPDLKDLKIHAWVNVFFVWSKDTLPGDSNHIVNRQRHWLAQPVHQLPLLSNYPNSVKEAKIEGLYVSPLHKEAQAHFIEILKDLIIHYPVDGIHLDYIRYPDQRFDLHPDIVKGFKNRYILDPANFLENPETFAQKFSLTGYEVFYYRWRRYLLDGLSEFVQQISDTVKTYSKNIQLSAAVKPDIVQAHWNFYQDWDRWVREGWLDFAVPMNYASDMPTFARNVEQYLEKLPMHKYLVGIALYNQSEKEVIRKIARIMALENPGYVLFSYEQIKKQKNLQRFLKGSF